MQLEQGTVLLGVALSKPPLLTGGEEEEFYTFYL